MNWRDSFVISKVRPEKTTSVRQLPAHKLPDRKWIKGKEGWYSMEWDSKERAEIERKLAKRGWGHV